MKTHFRFAILFLSTIICTQAHSQNVDKTIYDVNNALNTVDKTNEVVGKINGFFKKKPKSPATDSIQIAGHETTKTNNQQPDVIEQKTIITITGIDYNVLKEFENEIAACPVVKGTTKKYNTGFSVIEVTHSGTTDKLLDLILQNCKNVFTPANLQSSDEGKINIKL